MLGWAALLFVGEPGADPGPPLTEAAGADARGDVGPSSTSREPEQDGEAKLPVIVVRIPMHRADGAGVLEALRVHMSTPDVRVVLLEASEDFRGLRESLRWAAQAAEQYAAVGVFWLDLAEGEELVISVADPSGERVLTRTIPRDPQSPAAALEAVGIIARTTTLALVAGEEIGMRPATIDEPKPEPRASDPSPPVPKPQPKPTPLRAWPMLWVAAEYVGTNFGQGMPWQSGVGAQLGLRPLKPLVVGVGYTFFFPDEAAYAPVNLRLQRNPVTVAVGYHGPLGGRGAVEAVAIGGVDPVRGRVSGVEASAKTRDESLRVLVTAGALTRWLVYPWRTLGLHLGLGFEGVVSKFQYTVRNAAGEEQILLDPHGVRAVVTAGVSFGAVPRRSAKRAKR